jgi:hypothetical protein
MASPMPVVLPVMMMTLWVRRMDGNKRGNAGWKIGITAGIWPTIRYNDVNDSIVDPPPPADGLD